LPGNPVGDCPFHVVVNLSMGMNLAGLDWSDVVIGKDGTFVITIGPEPANGRLTPADDDQCTLSVRAC
jgi:hypothetical protein